MCEFVASTRSWTLVAIPVASAFIDLDDGDSTFIFLAVVRLFPGVAVST